MLRTQRELASGARNVLRCCARLNLVRSGRSVRIRFQRSGNSTARVIQSDLPIHARHPQCVAGTGTGTECGVEREVIRPPQERLACGNRESSRNAVMTAMDAYRGEYGTARGETRNRPAETAVTRAAFHWQPWIHSHISHAHFPKPRDGVPDLRIAQRLRWPVRLNASRPPTV
jgi:hypothetical protein